VDTQGGSGGGGYIRLGVQDNGSAAVDAKAEYVAQLDADAAAAAFRPSIFYPLPYPHLLFVQRRVDARRNN